MSTEAPKERKSDPVGAQEKAAKAELKAVSHFLHDRVVLLLLTVNVFMALVVILSVIFFLEGSATSGGYIVQYRPSLGISAFKTGSSVALYAFMVFAVLVVGLHTSLSMRAYAIRRSLSICILSVGTLLLVMAAIVANALLALD